MARALTPEQQETARMLMKFYNMQAGTAYRCADWRLAQVQDALDKCGGTIAVYKDYVRKYEAEGDKTDVAGFFEYVDLQTTKKPEPTADPAPVNEQTTAGALEILEQAVTHIIVNTQADKIRDGNMASVQQSVRDFIRAEYGAIQRKVTTVVDGKAVPQDEVVHDEFDTIVKFVANNKPVFLVGPAGTGKNVLCKQIAKALGLKFFFTNAVTQEYKLTGFTDAMGNYQPTQFYKAFTEGGLFMLDEMDASIPEVLNILNAAISNRYYDFPAPIGYVDAHPNFRVIAAGNTFGTGASYEYVGRNQLDAASLNRFATVPVDYCEAIENSVAGGDVELADFCRAFREEARKAGQQVVVSYRNIEMIATMKEIMELGKVLQTCLVKGMEKDDLNIIASQLPAENKYTRELRKLVWKM